MSLGFVGVVVFLIIAICVASYVAGGAKSEQRQAERSQEAQDEALEQAVEHHRETLEQVDAHGLASRLRGHAAKLRFRGRDK